MRNTLTSLIIILLLSACSSSAKSERGFGEAVETAVRATLVAQSGGTPASALSATETPHRADTPLPPALAKPKVSCPAGEVKGYLDELDSLLEAFDDTVTVAKSTSRIGLAPVIESMQSHKRSIRQLAGPECASYLTDLVMVAVETEIGAFLSFMAQESDTSVSRKLQAAQNARAAVDAQIEAFRKDPLDAYQTASLDAEKLVEGTQAVEPFVRPNDWADVMVASTSNLILSIPNTWTSETFGDDGEYLRLRNDDQTLTVTCGVLSSEDSTSANSDAVRLFALQTALETQDWDYYSERSAETGVYALNRGYVVQFSRRMFSSSDITDNQWAQIVTPDDKMVFLMSETTRDDFAKIDLLTLDQVFASIRTQE